MPTVLISGASIAGPTLAYWLARHGFEPTLLERAPAPRPGGHAVDIRGVALQVVQAMGLADAAHDLRTRMKGVSKLDHEGREVWRSETMTFTGGRFDNDDIEILRDDLAGILLGRLGGEVETIFGDTVTGLAEDAEGIVVSFAKQAPRRFDLVVGADGLRSNIRDLAFGDEGRFLHPLGVALGVWSAPNILGLADWQVSYGEMPDNCLVYPVRGNRELRVCVGMAAGLAEECGGDVGAQKALVAERFGQLGWEIPRLLEAMRSAPDFYLGAVAQVRMDRWTKGRVALAGDAGYCPSPFSGQGTSLALVGAYVLACELARSPADHAAAFARYEAKMRPYVEANQALVALSQEGLSEGAEVFKVMETAKNAITLDGLPAGV
jgi:2-polyprenyl-6-methoxyphenol hydroxylase-like FAD-dependent oxidoreductase